MAYDSIMSDRALREIYLMPFMLALKYAKPWAFMTALVLIPTEDLFADLSFSYNRVNGTHMSEKPSIIKNILRDEWKFTGMVCRPSIYTQQSGSPIHQIMSDWYGNRAPTPIANLIFP